MRKWTTTGLTQPGARSISANSNNFQQRSQQQQQQHEDSVTLKRVLCCRNGPLNEIECWAILGQTVTTMRTALDNYQHPTTIQSFIRNSKTPSRLEITADNLHLSPLGTVLLPCCEYSANFERFGLESLANTLHQAIKHASGSEFEQVLQSIQNGEISTMDTVENHVTENWNRIVGKTPRSRFVAQLCKVTLGWTSRVTRSISQSGRPLRTTTMRVPCPKSSASSAASSNCSSPEPLCSSSPLKTPPPQTSPLGRSFKSSTSTLYNGQFGDKALEHNKPASSRATKLTDPLQTQGYHHQVGLRSTARSGSQCSIPSVSSSIQEVMMKSLPAAKQRKEVARNPSRLYRVVMPLAEIAPPPSPATKRCIGPEFVVMSMEKEAIHLDLCSRQCKKDVTSVRDVEICMLNGQKLIVQVNPVTITAGEVLENVLREQDITEGSMFALAIKIEPEGELCPLNNDLKLSKVAPNGWKNCTGSGKTHNNNQFWPHSAFVLYQRFRYLTKDMDQQIKDPKNKHQLYLQLRREILSNRYNLSINRHLSLAAMALQVEFGDYSEDVHGHDYFMVEHYVPSPVLDTMGKNEAKSCLERLHRAYVGQGQSKTELAFCREIQNLDDFGFHLFGVSTEKGIPAIGVARGGLKALGIHVLGIFLLESSKDPGKSHKVTSSYFWHKIGRIEYDKSRFLLHVPSDTSDPGSKIDKLKFYMSGTKAKLLFDLAASHHQYANKIKANDNQRVEIMPDEAVARGNDDVPDYKEPSRPLRNLKTRLIRRSQSMSRKKMYTGSTPTTPVIPMISSRKGIEKSSVKERLTSLKRSVTTSEMSSPSKTTPGPKKNANYLVKRLAHYSSMADARMAAKSTVEAKMLNTSDKENSTPPSSQKNYRYKFYIEPEEDENPQGQMAIPSKPTNGEIRQPLREKPLSSLYPELGTPTVTAPKKRTRMVTMAAKKVTQPSDDKASTKGISDTPSGLRMGTRISLSALHRERLRLASELGLPGTTLNPLPPPPMVKSKASASLTNSALFPDDVTMMETKSIIPRPPQTAYVVHTSINTSQDATNEDGDLGFTMDSANLNDSLLQRFDAMETDQNQPERRIISTTLKKDESGKLGFSIIGSSGGIYVGDVGQITSQDSNVKLHTGDRVVAINGRSMENVSHSQAVELIKRSPSEIQLIVSQLAK